MPLKIVFDPSNMTVLRRLFDPVYLKKLRFFVAHQLLLLPWLFTTKGTPMKKYAKKKKEKLVLVLTKIRELSPKDAETVAGAGCQPPSITHRSR